MSNCDSELNSQLKALQARADRVDNDLIAHYAGISTLVMGLVSGSPASVAAAPLAPIYNMSSSGQTSLKGLTAKIPGISTFRNLQHIDAAGLVDNMGANLAAQVVGIADAAATQQAAMVQQQVAAATALEAAVENFSAQGLTGDALNTALAPFQAEVARTQGLVSQATSSVNMLNGFITTITNIAGCRTHSQIVQP